MVCRRQINLHYKIQNHLVIATVNVEHSNRMYGCYGTDVEAKLFLLYR